jgi:hypothetical protein
MLNYFSNAPLGHMAQAVLARAREFDIDRADFSAHLEIVRGRLK